MAPMRVQGVKSKLGLFQALIAIFLLLAGTGSALASGSEQDPSSQPEGIESGLCGLGYSELASFELPRHLDTLVSELKAFSLGTLPHETLEYRLKLRDFRVRYDLFIYSYINDEDSWWLDFRKRLNTLYETMGDYKDLWVRQDLKDPSQAAYNPETLIVLSHTVDQLLQSLYDYIEEQQIKAKLESPLRLPVKNQVKRKRLPKYYWRTTQYRPFFYWTGMQNLSFLVGEILSKAHGRLNKLKKLDDLVDGESVIDEYEKVVHDFRKQLRAVNQVLQLYPFLQPNDEQSRSDLRLIRKVYQRLGRINNKALRYDHDSTKGRRVKLNEKWEDLQAYMKENDFKARIQSLTQRFYDMEFSEEHAQLHISE